MKEVRETYNRRSVVPAVLMWSARIREYTAVKQCLSAMRDETETHWIRSLIFRIQHTGRLLLLASEYDMPQLTR